MHNLIPPSKTEHEMKIQEFVKMGTMISKSSSDKKTGSHKLSFDIRPEPSKIETDEDVIKKSIIQRKFARSKSQSNN